MPKVILMIGESGSGKSTWAANYVREHAKTTVRVNRDSYRNMLFNGPWIPRDEKLVRRLEIEAVKAALGMGFDVIVDDTNLIEGTQESWRNVAREAKVELIEHRMDTTMATCLVRDSNRDGREQVGRTVIERQFLTSGRIDFGEQSLVLVDVDGTLCNHTGVRNAYDESRVFLDKPYPVVCQWVSHLPDPDLSNNLSGYSVVIVSGRHDSCGPSTIAWLKDNCIGFDHILMRRGGDNRPDTVVKQEILDGILKVVPKERIAFVIDDRPGVVQMWKDNGLTVYPVRGTIHHKVGCDYVDKKDYGSCPDCGALEDF